jgi:hypothetical protein
VPISVDCNQCGRNYTVRDDAAGRRFKCKECGHVVQVPGAAVDEVSAIPSGEAQAEPATWGATGDFEPRADRGDRDELPRSGAGRASMWIGIGVWGVTLLGFLVLVGMSMWMVQQHGGRPPRPEDFLGQFAFGVMAFCGSICLSFAAAAVGCALAIAALVQENVSKTSGIVGLVLNGLYLLGAVAFVGLSAALG